MKLSADYWKTHHLTIITTTVIMIAIVGGFIWTYITIQNQQQEISALTVKIDSIASQLTILQQQNAMIRRSLVPRKGKRSAAVSPTPGFGI